MTPNIIRKIIYIIQTSVSEYIPGEGALCPVCLQLLNQRIRGYVQRTDPSGIRYCLCPSCSNTFKAVEKESSGRIPENIDAKPKRKQNRIKKS